MRWPFRPVACPWRVGALGYPLLGPLTQQLTKDQFPALLEYAKASFGRIKHDSAISERWPVLSASLTITRWRTIWTFNLAFGSAPCLILCGGIVSERLGHLDP